MRIQFVSSLTPEDEDKLADGLLAAIKGVLGPFPLAYAVRVETASGKVVEHHSPAGDEPRPRPAAGGSRGSPRVH